MVLRGAKKKIHGIDECKKKKKKIHGQELRLQKVHTFQTRSWYWNGNAIY